MHRFAYFKLIRQLIKEGEVSISERHPSQELAVKVKLFADGDLTVFISNPAGRFDEKTYEFLLGAYQKVHKKIRSLAALRKDIERIGSLLATGASSLIYSHFGNADSTEIAGILGFGFVFPELKEWSKKAYGWVTSL